MVPGLILYLITYIPALIVLFFLSFQTYVPGQMYSPLVTLDNYGRFLSDPYYSGLALTSLYLSILASLVSVAIGYPLAYSMVRSSNLRRIILPVVALSFFVSALVRLYGWLGILARGGPINELLTQLGLMTSPISILFTPVAVVIGLADFGIPYAVLILAGSINNLDESLEHASQNLGATRWQAHLRVTLPLTFPGVLAALVLTFALNMSAVLTPLLLGGTRVPTLATQVYNSMVTTLNYPFASSSLVILLLAVFALTFATGRALRTRAMQ
jgi:putative spermidine/putrescine transport system permease protein